MKTLLNPGLKPVNRFVFYALATFFVFGNLIGLPAMYLSDWVDHQIREAAGIEEKGVFSYVLTIDENNSINLNKREMEEFIITGKCEKLDEQEHEILNRRLMSLANQFPANIYDDSLAGGMMMIFAAYAVFFLAFIIMFSSTLHRAWKSVQTLKILDPAQAADILTPGKGSGFIFIPLANIFLAFKSFTKLVEKGNSFAKITGTSYNGPSKRLGIICACIFVWKVSTVKFSFDYMTTLWYIDMLVLILSIPVLVIMASKLNAMTRNFSQAAIEHDEPEHTATN